MGVNNTFLIVLLWGFGERVSIKQFLKSAKCLATYVTVDLYGPGAQSQDQGVKSKERQILVQYNYKELPNLYKRS